VKACSRPRTRKSPTGQRKLKWQENPPPLKACRFDSDLGHHIPQQRLRAGGVCECHAGESAHSTACERGDVSVAPFSISRIGYFGRTHLDGHRTLSPEGRLSLTRQFKSGVVLVASCVAACGGGGGGGPPPATYSVSGYVSGLTGSGLTLSYNGGAPLAISRNGVFAAATVVATGAAYSVAIVDQPSNPAQACTVSNGSGTVGTANVVSVAVFCPQAVGTLAYVVGAGVLSLPGTPPTPGSISVYTINASSGALTLVPGSAASTGPGVGSFQLVPHSDFAWGLDGADPASDTNASMYVYTVDPTTGSYRSGG
jgi:hypothetical protein